MDRYMLCFTGNSKIFHVIGTELRYNPMYAVCGYEYWNPLNPRRKGATIFVDWQGTLQVDGKRLCKKCARDLERIEVDK